MIPWLREGEDFPAVRSALRRPNGLLAASAEITPARLVAAYAQGVFPWYAQGEPVLWWSPDPRMVLYVDEFRVSRSLRKTLAQVAASPSIELWLDRDFAAVMRACAQPRSGQPGTWITDEILAAYSALHRAGLAHSVETWIDGELAGGLYGVALGRMFYGESMFARTRDASKIALATLVGVLRHEGVSVIDCQQDTAHLASLGARAIPRAAFCAHLEAAVPLPAPDWKAYAAHPLNHWLKT
jgi:leucyl/phenylalanyl-tRNA--protein transferase